MRLVSGGELRVLGGQEKSVAGLTHSRDHEFEVSRYDVRIQHPLVARWE